MLRILVINYEYPPIGGGGGVVTKNIVEHMIRLGHKVTIITSLFADLKKQETINGVNIFRVPVFSRSQTTVASIISMLTFLPSSVAKSFIQFNGSQFDIINTHFAVPSGPTGYILSKLFQIPNVLSIHGGDIFDPSKRLSPHQTSLLSNTVRVMLKTADRVVAQSNNTMNNAYQYYKINRPIDLIPLGINKPVFERKTRSQLNLDSDDFVFCTIGRLVKRKNIDDILEILSKISTIQKLKFIVIGEGPEYIHLMELTKRLNLREKVIMTGNISNEEKFQYLYLSDCYVSTALHEGFGLVFLEAMESGIPIVCYNHGGQTDFLIDGKTGFLVELGDKKKFKKKICELMNNPELRLNISTYNKKLVQHYYINECTEKYLNLFNETISEYLNSKNR